MNSHAGSTIAARFILSILADKAKDDGYCYPAPEWLARRVNCDVSTVRRAIRALNEEGSLLTRKNGADSFRKYEHLVLVGLSLHEIQAALQKHFGPDSDRMIFAIQQQSPLYFQGRMHEKGAGCTKKKAECTKKMQIRVPGTCP
jgi:DNA-binding GntR family transcriptional regulator